MLTELWLFLSSLHFQSDWSSVYIYIFFTDMDKEDALICFEEHIRMLEQEYDDEKERERRRQKRIQRKNRESFLVSDSSLNFTGTVRDWKNENDPSDNRFRVCVCWCLFFTTCTLFFSSLFLSSFCNTLCVCT